VGDLGEGIEILGELYVESNDPVFVHNQGRCYQQNGQWQKAINRFEEYLRKATGLSQQDRTVVERYILECEAKLDKMTAASPAPQSTQAVAPPPPVADTQVAPRDEPPSTPMPLHPVATTPAQEPENPGHAMRVGGVVAAAAGLATLGAGIGFNLAERSLHNQMSSDATKATSANEDRRSTYQTVSIIGYAIGATALVTGVTLYVLGARKPVAAERVLLMVDVSSDAASLGLKGRF
jgi:hypothetical protein